MAEEAAAATETPEDGAPKARKGGLVLTLIAAVASLVAGGGVGAFVVGPRLGGGAGSGTEAHGEAMTEESGGGGHGGETKASPVYTLDNLVVNPAGTSGPRFLIVSFAVEVGSSGLVETLAEHDAEIRDAVLHMLASRTVDQLNDLATRDKLKVEVRQKIESLIGASNVHSIFIPQFVLQ